MTDFSAYLIVTDLDGTFLNKKGGVVQRNLDAVARFCAGGGRFTVNTGRTHFTLSPVVPQPHLLLNAPASHCNGAYLYDFATKEFFLEEYLTSKDAADILDFSARYCPDVSWRPNAHEKVRVYTPPEEGRPIVLGAPDDVLDLDTPPTQWKLDDWYKVVYVGKDTRIAQLRKEFEAFFAERFAITSSCGHAIEVQLPHASKAVGLEKLRQLSPELAARTIIACGDFENDIPMLKAADVATCPANAMDEVKELCDLVLCPCDEGVIADVIEAIEDGRITPKTV